MYNKVSDGTGSRLKKVILQSMRPKRLCIDFNVAARKLTKSSTGESLIIL